MDCVASSISPTAFAAGATFAVFLLNSEAMITDDGCLGREIGAPMNAVLGASKSSSINVPRTAVGAPGLLQVNPCRTVTPSRPQSPYFLLYYGRCTVSRLYETTKLIQDMIEGTSKTCPYHTCCSKRHNHKILYRADRCIAIHCISQGPHLAHLVRPLSLPCSGTRTAHSLPLSPERRRGSSSRRSRA